MSVSGAEGGGMPVEVIYFNVGQGDCTFLWFYEVPGGGGGAVSSLANRQGVGAALIDCGSLLPTPHHSTVGRAGTDDQRMVGHIRQVIADRLGRNTGAAKDRLDYLFISHPDADHHNKLGDLLCNPGGTLDFGIEDVWYTGEPKDYHQNKAASFMYKLLQPGQQAQLANGPHVVTNAPVSVGLCPETESVPIAPGVSGLPELSLVSSSLYAQSGTKKLVSRTAGKNRPSTWKNAASLVFMLTGAPDARTGHRQKVLLMADAERGVEEFLMDSDVVEKKYQRDGNLWLKAGHHGSKEATSPDWVAYTTPDAVFFSSGRKAFGGTGMPAEDHLKDIRTSLAPPPVILPHQRHDYTSFQRGAKPSEFVVQSTQDGICTTLTESAHGPRGQWLGTDWHLILDDPQPGAYHLEYN